MRRRTERTKRIIKNTGIWRRALAVFMVLTVFAGLGICGGRLACSKAAEADGAQSRRSSDGGRKDSRLRIVATIFPEYDWVRNILGDEKEGAEVTMLLDNGVDLHSYQPTAKDIMKISDCDLLIYVGGESDQWIDDAIKEAVNKDMVAVNLLAVMGENARTEETVEGMETEGYGKEEDEYDEHVWLSLKNAKLFCEAISDALSKIDTGNADIYEANAQAYVKKLAELDGKYQKAVDSSKKHTLLFADRFPFRYLVDDYGLSYYAAFAGCSSESDASFKTIRFLAAKTDELSLQTVLTVEKSDGKAAKAVINNTKSRDQKVMEMDSMQSVTAEDCSRGVTYLSVMEKNLAVLEEALQ